MGTLYCPFVTSPSADSFANLRRRFASDGAWWLFSVFARQRLRASSGNALPSGRALTSGSDILPCAHSACNIESSNHLMLEGSAAEAVAFKPVLVIEREARLFIAMFPVGSQNFLRHRGRRRVTERAWTLYFTLTSVKHYLF